MRQLFNMEISVRWQVFMPDSSLPPERQKANFMGESMKKNKILFKIVNANLK